MNSLEKHFNQMNRRERRLVALCAIVVVAVITYTVVCQPLIDGTQEKQSKIRSIKHYLETQQVEQQQSNIPVLIKKEASLINSKSLVESLRVIFPPQQFAELNQLDLSFEEVQNYLDPLEKTLCQYQIELGYEQGLKDLLGLVSSESLFIERLIYKNNNDNPHFNVSMSWLSKRQNE